MQPLPFRQQDPVAPAYSRGWVDEAVAAIEADQCRTADTHLIRLIVPALAGIDIYLKDESTHPTGSLKHRLARSLFLYALCNGHIRERTPVIEASSGSTAVSEAYFAQMIGVPFYAVMPRTTSAEKIAAIEHYGGNCHLIDDGRALYAEAAALAARLNGHYMDQFTFAERATDWRGNNNIAESIFTQLKGETRPLPDWIVMGAGTGGTSATIGRYLRYRQYPTRLCVADVEHSAFYDCFRSQDRSRTCERPSLIEGVGRPRCEPSFVPGVVDRMMKIPDAASIAAMNVLSRRLRRAVGGSTGTNVPGAVPARCRDAKREPDGIAGDADLRFRRTLPADLLRARMAESARPRSGAVRSRLVVVPRYRAAVDARGRRRRQSTEPAVS
ncbi:cysteine synthase A [Bradyrhizobium sp. LM2.7]